jgi:aryl-alcohol dehydrogenase-like predicted oxidoreductase
MRFRTLGRTGLAVSEISLGTVEMGLDYGITANGQARRPAEADAARLLHRALDLGVNFIDTARAYGDSEAIIGRALQGRRKEFALCSKALCHSGETFDGLRKKVTESVDTSLRLLGTDIDIMMVHSAPFEVIARGEMVAILEELKREGKFRWIGASVYGEDAALAAIRSGRYDCLQVAYSALDRQPEAAVLREAESNGVGIVARSVLLKGALTPRYHYLPDSFAALKTAAARLETVAESARMSLPELAYRYVLSRPAPQTALVGASALHELDAAVSFAEPGPLPAALIERVWEIEVAQPELLNPGIWGVG